MLLSSERTGDLRAQFPEPVLGANLCFFQRPVRTAPAFSLVRFGT